MIGVSSARYNLVKSLRYPSSVFRRSINYKKRLLEKNSDLDTPLIQHLTDRGLIASVTSNNLTNVLEGQKVSVYCGADPTAQSLHVGNLIPLIILLHFRIRGHGVIGVVGGATGQVGDPSGRTTERTQIQEEVRNNNVDKIRGQLNNILERGGVYAEQHGFKRLGPITVTNNADWWTGVSFLGFLGTYGRHIRVGQMLARDSVKNRMETQQGIGFNEFAYQVLQAYDFWHLYNTQNCRIQVGGNDQWGNITAGIDLINRLKGPEDQNEAYGVTVPLLTTASGEKFGKSAGNAVWLDPSLTKPFELYQYFVRSPDNVVASYLKLFTLIPLQEIELIMQKHKRDESQRIAQHILASEVTDLVHGPESGLRAHLISSFLYNNKVTSKFSTDDILSAFEGEGLSITVSRDELVGQPWRDVLSKLLEKSKCKYYIVLLLFYRI